ncbi:MAG: flavodoxin domain-containing protein [Syntrophales bacterium]|nr:flavodoxin domain-containing protein [Syntrophales bacterium]MDD5641937.1 flavodoxin domain-containing protein [Syntrophales bacterium]
MMKVLNLYFSSTGNTVKVAHKIDEAIRETGHQVETIRITPNTEVDILPYDCVFLGSGVYEWLPGEAVIRLLTKLRRQYADGGEIKPTAPRRSGKKAIVYCTYGGCHTGVNEAIPTTKYMAQLFDHLGYDVVAEWHLIGEYHGKLAKLSTIGRLGDIQGRPNDADLREVAEKVKGIIQV